MRVHAEGAVTAEPMLSSQSVQGKLLLAKIGVDIGEKRCTDMAPDEGCLHLDAESLSETRFCTKQHLEVCAFGIDLDEIRPPIEMGGETMVQRIDLDGRFACWLVPGPGPESFQHFPVGLAERRCERG